MVIAEGGGVPVSGTCMAPLIPHGAAVNVEKCGSLEVRAGDIVVVEAGGAFVAHRFLGRYRAGGETVLLTKPDNRRRPDAPGPAGALVGRVTAIVKDGKIHPYRAGAVTRMFSWLYGFLWMTAAGAWRRGRARAGSGDAAEVLSIRIAGGRVLIRCERRAAGRLRRWLGPWAEEPRREWEHGAVVLLDYAAGGDAVPEGMRREQGFMEAALGGLRLKADWRKKPWEVRAGVGEGGETAAARTVLRLLGARMTIEAGGAALHGSSVRTAGGTVIFAGPSGAGKTTAARRFPEDDRLDDDMVLIAEREGRMVRLDMPDFDAPARRGPGESGELPLRAVFVPERAAAGRVRRLAGAEAVTACLHVPHPVVYEGPGGGPAVQETLEAMTGLAAAVPVARFEWSLDDDVPRMVKDFLEDR